ncbi:MAG: aspartate-semialdehyde dehydrogenase, partial [Erysipelotrichaceae bacterium]|nr:aspartate-semialdehyde dehydrogenase [Erysipelotrichaceae bacterium]
MKNYRVGILGATGMVGQRFATLLENHPWFHVTALAASSSSAGKTYREAAGNRWAMQTPMPESMADMIVMDASHIDEIAPLVDFVFCAVAMKNEEILALEQAYAKAEIPVISNNKTHRGFDDVPMVIPELNADHVDVIPTQRKRLGTKKGFVAVKSNCSIQSYVPALTPIKDQYGLKKVLACTYQAISGAGKTFERWPEMLDNVIPYIGGEEEKSEKEPLKVWGKVVDGHIVNDDSVSITTQCLRVPVSDGHMAAVFASFEKKPSIDEIKKAWAA